MQLGHLGIALAIASLDPRPETFAVVGAAQFLPNAYSRTVRPGLTASRFPGPVRPNAPERGAAGPGTEQDDAEHSDGGAKRQAVAPGPVELGWG